MTTSKKKPHARKSSKSSKTRQTKIVRSQIADNKKALREFYINNLGFKSEKLEQLISFVRLNGQEKVKASRKVIQDSIIDAGEDPDERFALAVEESETLLKGYSTLDDPHRVEIQKLIDHITAYLRDSTRKRPFNALMLAAPGAGKSHFIKQLANAMKEERVQAVTFNMANMQFADDMAQPVDELRNLKVNDKFP